MYNYNTKSISSVIWNCNFQNTIMYHNGNLTRERNERINKLIRLIRTAEAKNEIINKTTLKHAELGSPATLGRDLALIGDEGEQVITFDKHKRTFRMNKNWKKAKHIKIDPMTDYGTLGILKSLLNQYRNTPLYAKVIERVRELANMPIEDFSRIAVPPKPEYNKEDQKKFSKIFDYMIQDCKIQFYYKGRWHGEERKNCFWKTELLIFTVMMKKNGKIGFSF